jgi:hypothetical protein
MVYASPHAPPLLEPVPPPTPPPPPPTHARTQYDFPGSNSGIDVHALTGWLPESMRTSDKSFDADRTWERLLSGSQFGDCLITIATGPLTEAQELEYGLVESHAYVVEVGAPGASPRGSGHPARGTVQVTGLWGGGGEGCKCK